METVDPYRAATTQTRAHTLAAAGASRRAAGAADPLQHNGLARVSDPRSTRMDEFEAKLPLLLMLRAAPKLLYYAFLLWFGVLMAFVGGVTWLTGNPLHAPPLLVLIFVATGVGVSYVRNGPRRWLAKQPYRVDGYLELVGREERVVRLLARVHFQGAAPDPRFLADLLVGAGHEQTGLVVFSPTEIGLHSPELSGNAGRVHGWFQRVVDDALHALDDVASVRFIDVQER